MSFFMGRLCGNLGAGVNVIYVVYLSVKYTIKNKFILFYNFVRNSIEIVSTTKKVKNRL